MNLRERCFGASKMVLEHADAPCLAESGSLDI